MSAVMDNAGSSLVRGIEHAAHLGLAGMVGFIAFSSPVGLALCFLLPWLMVRHTALRWWPAAVMGMYWMGANATLVDTLRAYDPMSGAMAYVYPVILTALLTAPFLLVDPAATPWRRAMTVAGALLLVTVPPIGLLGWQSPLFAAALIYPQTGVVGVLLCAMIMGLIAGGALAKDAPRGVRRLAMLVFAVAAAALVMGAHNPVPRGLAHWIGVDTHFGPQPDGREPRGAQIAAKAEAYLNGNYDVVVFPESVLPSFSAADQMALNPMEAAAKRLGTVIIAGATHPVTDGPDRWANVLQAFGAHQGVIQESRLPAPVGNWRVGEGVRVRPFASDLLRGQDRTGARTVAVSICYENLVLWGHAGLLTGRAEALVAVGNHWFAGGTRIPAIDRTSVWALARLAGVPVIAATNRAVPSYE